MTKNSAAMASMAANASSARQQRIIDRFHGQLYDSNRLDVQTGRLWDCICYAAGGTFTIQNGTFFTNVDRSSGKTYLETNLYQSKKLDAPEAFAIERVIFTFSKSADPLDVAMCWDEMWWQFFLGQKCYLWSPLAHMQTVKEPLSPIRICDFCKSVYANATTCPGCGANSFALSTLGEIDSGQQFAMDVNPTIPIVNQISFWLGMNSKYPLTFRAPIKIWCHFEGLHARGVQ
jgi:hypothetical protein